MRKIVIMVVCLACSACATKSFPMAESLSSQDAYAMTCQQLAVEIRQVEQIRTAIYEQSRIDWRSIIGYINDLGIGNALAHDQAIIRMQARFRILKEAMANNMCAEELELSTDPLQEGPPL